jgi:hypothetical protein
MTSTNPQNIWRAALSAALCGAVAALITVESPARLYAQAPAGRGRGAVPPGEALFTSAQAVAGKAAYERNCASCHGASVDDGNSAPPLRGAAFLGKYAGRGARFRDDSCSGGRTRRLAPQRLIGRRKASSCAEEGEPSRQDHARHRRAAAEPAHGRVAHVAPRR